MAARRHIGLAAVVVVLSVLMIALSLGVGQQSVGLRQAWADWRSGVQPEDSQALFILMQLRLPRTLVAILAGCGLALVGCAFQALLRNPLATPYTLGIASAGAFGAWTASILLQGTALWITVFHFSPVQVMAFLFAGADVLVIYTLAARRERISSSVLLLTGVTLGMLSNAGILLMRYLARPDQYLVMDRWLMGGVDVVGYDAVITLLIGVIPCGLVLLAQSAKFDQLGFSPDMAAGRGVNVRRLQATTFLVASLMTGIVVSTVGPIGFVGLIVPHAVRTIVGPRHRVLMPLTAIAGGGFLCFCDIVSRKLITGEAPIGLVTALLGGPFFLYLLLRKRSGEWT